MVTISSSTASGLFTGACSHVLKEGALVAPRSLATREVLAAGLRLDQPRARLVDLPPARRLNPAFAAAEALWILSGSDEPWIHDFNAHLARYTGAGSPHGAYGPRLRSWTGGVDQVDRVRQLLLHDPDSRRATVQIFDPARDLADHKDIPCTLGHRFYVRDGRLHMHTTMRSQDAWLGLPYDVFTATVLHELMAGWLGVRVGVYRSHIDSLHLYEQHWTAVDELPADPPASEVMAPLRVAWGDFDPLARQVIAGEPVGAAGWDDFAAVLASYRLWKAGQRDSAREAAAGPGTLCRALTRWYAHLDRARPAAQPERV